MPCLLEREAKGKAVAMKSWIRSPLPNEMITRYLPHGMTTALLVLAVTLAWRIEKLETLNQIGGFIAGFAGALAFVWLVAAYHLQGNELKLQREELKLQRASLDLQKEELRRATGTATGTDVKYSLSTGSNDSCPPAEGLVQVGPGAVVHFCVPAC
jgi:hypothetical protein